MTYCVQTFEMVLPNEVLVDVSAFISAKLHTRTEIDLVRLSCNCLWHTLAQKSRALPLRASIWESANEVFIKAEGSQSISAIDLSLRLVDESQVYLFLNTYNACPASSQPGMAPFPAKKIWTAFSQVVFRQLKKLGI